MKKISIKTAVLAVFSLVLVFAVAMFVGCGSSGSSAVGPLAKRTFVSDFRTNTDYTFIHGNMSPDGTALYAVVNETSSTNGGETSQMTGAITAYILDMDDLAAGTVTADSIIAQETISGMAPAAKTIAFRSSFSPQSTKLIQAGRDRVLVFDTSTLGPTTLTPTNGATGDTNIAGGSASFENHDALAIDEQYAVLALQSHLTSTSDGGVAAFVLYDMDAGAAIGNAVNACDTCHNPTQTKNHFMCGIDGKLTKNSSTGIFTGDIYVATTSGGHIVKVPVTIDPTNTTTPIVVGTQTRKQISDSEGNPSAPNPDIDIMPNFHDVRFDSAANRVYYSAIKTDSTTGAAMDRAHLGYWDLDADTVVDASISATDAAIAGLVYCGSGQTDKYFVPMTMSYPAYIDVVPKALITNGAKINP